ncbi:MAG: hypothetical protein M1334_00840 [Patescibacteria group bacterium]|nr:hypothetical protein [Patescibacteria group bacterium]
MNRRLILIIIIIAVILFASILAYFIYSFFTPKTPATTATSTAAGFTTPSGNQNQTAAARISLVSQNPVVDYSQNNNGGVYYITPSGEIISNNSGQENALSQPLSSNILDAQFSNDGQKILIKTGNFKFSLFDVASSTMTPLDSLGKIDGAAFSPASSSQIAYLQNNGMSDNLDATNFGGQKIQTQTLATFAQQDYQISWPTANTISLIQKPSSYFPGSAIIFNVSSKYASMPFYSTPGLMINWLANGLGLEFSSSVNNRGGNINLINNSGQQIGQLNVSTLPSKCAFDANSSSTLYCAVPRDANFASQVLPDNYLMRAVYTSDNIYKIDLNSNQIGLYFNDPLENYDMSDIKIFGNTLYFINRYDQKLYKMTLS